MDTQKTFESEIGTFTFRKPKFRDMIEFDVLSAKLRQGVAEDGLTYGLQAIVILATLNTLVVEPKGYDFGDEENSDAVMSLYGEVDAWIGNSFRGRNQDGAEPAGEAVSG